MKKKIKYQSYSELKMNQAIVRLKLDFDLLKENTIQFPKRIKINNYPTFCIKNARFFPKIQSWIKIKDCVKPFFYHCHEFLWSFNGLNTQKKLLFFFIVVKAPLVVAKSHNFLERKALAGRSTFARPCEGVYRSTSLMSSSLLFQQCSACLVCLIRIVFMMGGWWPYSCCFVGCCLQDLFNTARSILV